jgi:peptidase M48-like protein
MRIWTIVGAVLILSVMPPGAAAQTSSMDQMVDRIVTQEKAEMQMLRQYSPLVETYIQMMRPDAKLGPVPAGDKYFLGKAQLENGVDLESFASDASGVRHKLSGIGSVFSVEFLPRGFLQMIYLDTNGFDQQNYRFDYVRREFLGDVRCLVFDVTPNPNAGKGRFMGRIWVEDQAFHIVRFNGAYNGASRTNFYFHFDSWRILAGPQEWLPAYVYSEEGEVKYAMTRRLTFKSQTRLWGYNVGRAKQEQELNKIMVEAALPVKDQAEGANDYSPLQAQRNWDLQAEDNVVDRMERLGLLAPRGEVDKVLETVVNNIEVTNNLNIEPEVRCRVLTTSTLESFTISHTIVVSRGLIDVLPDEASLATLLARELGHVVLAHRIDTQYAFFDRMLFDEKDTFRHFGFRRTPEEEQAAAQKGAELLQNSPYKDQLATAKLFIQALQDRTKDVPNLISPHLGDRIPNYWAVSSPANRTRSSSTEAALPQPGLSDSAASGANNKVLAALPLGGRIKMDPWSDELTMLKAKPVSIVAEREKMPFEVTPFVIYLTREQQPQSTQPQSTKETSAVATSTHDLPAVAADSQAGPSDPVAPSPDTK